MKRAKYLFSTCLLILLSFSFSTGFHQPSSSSVSPSNAPQVIHNGKLIYLANTVIVKYKSSTQNKLYKSTNIENELSALLKDYNVQSVQRTFTTDDAEAQKIGLDRIMTVNYLKNMDPLIAAAKMRKLPNVEWAEPKYLRQVFFTPNDTSYNSTLQWYLFKIDAQQAWDVSKGDSSVLIGIVDTGVDWPHPDLRANMWDSIGYDFGGLNGTPDNNPMEDAPYHGTLIAGLASAVTNNITGVASIGFKSHIIAVKTARNDMKDSNGEVYISYGYEGIAYAAYHGAKVINCSWGGPGYSDAEQEVINYAIAKGALVVAAAGNDNSNEDFYPAGYQGVLAVAATDESDHRSFFSNYGYNIGCTAPGEHVYGTWQPNTYISNIAGTSVSAPLVSGLAALVASHFPNYSPLQIAQQIRVNCDNIDSLNPGYQYLLGAGRVNAYKALTNTNSVAVRAYDFQYTGDSVRAGNNFLPGEKVSLKVKFRNYLNPVSNVTVTVQSLSPYAIVQNGSFNISSIGTMDSTSNDSNPFTFTIANNVPFDDTLAFLLKYSENNYTDFQATRTPANHSYLTQDGNNISVTITSRGNIGFNDYPSNQQGMGFEYAGGPNLLFEGALMYGTSISRISDAARDSSDGSVEDASFRIISPLRIKLPGSIASEEGIETFDDSNGGSSAVGVIVNMHSYSFDDNPGKDYIILKYSFTSRDSTGINNFYAGLFLDWDLAASSGDSDLAVYDNTGNFGYVYHLGGNPDTYIGAGLISAANYGYWAILNPGGDGGFALYDGFTKSEKWQALSSRIGKSSAGPGDISEVVSAGPISIPKGDTVNVAFAIAAGTSVSDLRTKINDARDKYKTLVNPGGNRSTPHTFTLYQNYPNPFNPGTYITYQIHDAGHVTLKIYDVLGRYIQTLVDEPDEPAGLYTVHFNGMNLASGVYFYQLKSDNNVAAKKFVLLK
jgi:subtilisin family serine protease